MRVKIGLSAVSSAGDESGVQARGGQQTSPAPVLIKEHAVGKLFPRVCPGLDGAHIGLRVVHIQFNLGRYGRSMIPYWLSFRLLASSFQ